MIKYLKLAEKQALKSKERYKLGCLIIKNGEIIGKGFNINKTHPKYGSGWCKYIHAESKAIWDAISSNKNLEDSVAYIFRTNGLLSKPCKDCQKLLKRFKVKEVVYSSNKTFKKEKL